jgi:hypothetical protein
MIQASERSSGKIERFLDMLTSDGFAIGVRESLKVHRLSDILAKRNLSLKSNNARAMFTALIARDSTEQRRVAELYKSIFDDERPPPPPPPPPGPAAAVALPLDPKFLGQTLAAIAAMAMIALFFLVYNKTSETGPILPKTEIQAGSKSNGDTRPPEPTTPVPTEWTTDDLYTYLVQLIEKKKLPAAPTLHEMQKAGWPPKEVTGGVQLDLPALVQRLQMPPDWPIDLNAQTTRRRIKSAFADFGVKAQLPQTRLESGNSGVLNVILSDISSEPALANSKAEDFIGLSYQKRVEKFGDLALNTKLDTRDKVIGDLIDRALAITVGRPEVDSEAFSDARWNVTPPSMVTKAPAWLRPAATVAPLIVAGFWFLGLAGHRRSRIGRAAIAYPPLDRRLVLEAPQDIRVNRTDKAYFMRVATSLNVRQTVSAVTVDPDRTVAASIAAGGLFTPVRGRITATPAYLIFVEAKCAGDQEACRLEMLYLRLADAGVNVKRFFYFDSPAWLHEDFDDDPRPIEDVAAHHEDRRLIILGEGRGFLMPLTNAPQPWTQALAIWPQRAMLTPRPLKEWGDNEFAIANGLGLPLGRATIEGLFALAELLGLDESRDRPLFRPYGFTGGFDLKPLPALIRSQPYYWLSESDPGEADTKRLDTVLHYYLDAEGLLWLKALAVFPTLQWDLTIYLGRELAIYEEPRLAALTRLPWLREGQMPLWLRQRFIASLPDDIRVQTIAAIHRLMTADETPKNARRKLTLLADPMRQPSLRGREPSRDDLFVATLANEGDFPAPAAMNPSVRRFLATLSWRELGVAAAAWLYAAAAWKLAPVPSDGALGPGAFMPLTILALVPLIGWLGLAWFEARAQISSSPASWRIRIKGYLTKRLYKGFEPLKLSTDIADFELRDMSFGGTTKPVLVIGDTGPAIMVMHEMYGFTPTLARFCRWVRDAGFRVYAPILLGTPDAANQEVVSLHRIAKLCISREFTMLTANRSSPITDWLRQLAHLAHNECGGPGVGVIGLCLTGGFALSMSVDPAVLAPVLGEPSQPWLAPAALDIAPAELAVIRSRIATEGLSVRGYRFQGDTLCRAARFETLRRELGGGFVGRVLPDACGNPAGMKSRGKPPHSVFTGDLIDAEGEPTRAAVDEVIGFFREKLSYTNESAIQTAAL